MTFHFRKSLKGSLVLMEKEKNYDKIPFLAFLLGYLVPGMGHIYIGKKGKGLFFLVLLLGTFLFGFYLCDGSEVAPWQKNGYGKIERRYSFLAQAGIGLAAWIPAGLQGFTIPVQEKEGGIIEPRWSLGLLYMMISGILNLLVAQDAYEKAVFLKKALKQEKKE
ncbi:MAG: hypothetical protein D6785_13875 [Planctomycetota bacterium]|nr:MAG: hypothetical protein D6785_13875 [Planctomycetota bacterium]